MLCPECGSPVPAEFSHCPYCGEPQSTAPRPRAQTLEDTEQEAAFITPLFRFPPLTVALLLVNVVVFLLLEQHGGSRDELTLLIFGAKFRAPILDGELWRLVTANFLHIGYWHLLLNGLTLVQLGMVCENIYGRTRFFILYLVTGIGGFLASMVLSDTLSAGASASLFGLMGAILTFGWRHSRQIPPALRPHFTWYLLPWVALMILFGLFYGGIDNWAHIGGLLTGVIMGLVLHNQTLAGPRTAGSRLGVAVAFSALVLFSAHSLWEATFQVLSLKDIRQAVPGTADPEGEIEVISRFIDRNSTAGLYFYLRGESQLAAHRIDAAEDDFRAALLRKYESPALKNQLAWLLITEGELNRPRIEEAVKLAREAVRAERNGAFLNTLGWALYLRGDTVAAITQLQAAQRAHSSSDPTRILDLHMLAMAHFKKGDRERARQLYDEALELERSLANPSLADRVSRGLLGVVRTEPALRDVAEDIEEFRLQTEVVLGLKPLESEF